jgi:starvation-inducible outer membrane lipoprotein
MTNLTPSSVNRSSSSLRRIPRGRAGLAAGIVALALVAGACSSSPKTVSTKTPTSATTKTSTAATTKTTQPKSGGAGGGAGF